MQPRAKRMRTRRTRLHHRVMGCLGLLLLTSCSSIQSFIPGAQPRPDEASLAIQVNATATSGQYEISGTTDLPEGTTLTVMAIRYLNLRQSPLQETALKPTYSILAYNTIETEGDRWQTQLSLWRVAPDGQFKEAWQLHEPDLTLAVDPEDTVVFLASLSPLDDLEAIEQQLSGDQQRFASRFVRTTVEGDRYLQVAQALPVALPSGETSPQPIPPEDLNGGWGNRFLDLPDPPNLLEFEFPEQRQTNAPLSSEELLY